VNPTFDNVALTDYAATEDFGSLVTRTTRETLPDVQGEFFQVAPASGRTIVIRGVLASTTQVSADLAGADLKARIRAHDDLVGSVAAYQGADSVLYSESLLLSYDQAGPMEISPQGAGLQAVMRVEARVLTQP